MHFKVRMKGTDVCRIIPCQPGMLDDFEKLQAKVRERFAADGPLCLFAQNEDGRHVEINSNETWRDIVSQTKAVVNVEVCLCINISVPLSKLYFTSRTASHLAPSAQVEMSSHSTAVGIISSPRPMNNFPHMVC